MCMSRWRTARIVFTAAIAACLAVLPLLPAAAAPSAAQVEEDRERVERALEELESARLDSARVQLQIDEALQTLDGVIAEQQQAHARLSARVNYLYRSGGTPFLWVLLSARTFEEFTTRWDLLMRMNRQDAADIHTLEAARVEAELLASSLVDLQAEQLITLDALAARVERARTELASSEVALAAYEAAIAEREREEAAAAQPKPVPEPAPTVTGTGAWQTAVASHYSLTFTGLTASGEVIGPYSMIVAHKTLPFGTLIEFEYNGKLAVAHVADRGPYIEGREFDLGPGVIRILDFRGVHEVRYRIIS